MDRFTLRLGLATIAASVGLLVILVLMVLLSLARTRIKWDEVRAGWRKGPARWRFTPDPSPRWRERAVIDCITTLVRSQSKLEDAKRPRFHEGANVMLIIGCDFHPGFQQVAIFDNQSGEIQERRLGHRDDAGL